MKYLIISTFFFLILNGLLYSQDFTITLQFDKKLKGCLIIKDSNLSNPDTVCIDSFFTKKVIKNVSIKRYEKSKKVVPLFFELSLKGIANFSGLTINSDAIFTVSIVEGKPLIKQKGRIEENDWYYHLVDTLENLFPMISNNDTMAQSIAVNLLTVDSSYVKSEVNALLLFQLLTMDAIGSHNINKARNYLAKYQDSFWAPKALRFIDDNDGKNKKKISSIYLTDTLGNKFYLEDMMSKEYLLLDFWATWCGPCLKGIPLLKEVFSKCTEKLDIVSISIDKNKTQWRKVNAELSLPWESIIDNTLIEDKLEYKLNITSIPMYILLDKNQEVMYRGNDLSKVMEKIGL
ncbi:MAG: redoxin domain-containing protein [Saprospiraceae bacterium]|nr:MAG: redoxin domain-containing protein [Saprospiraceae bacterium]